MPARERNYRQEYDNYHKRPGQVKNRAARNASRAVMEKNGMVSKGDGRDVHHSDGNPRNVKASNLKVTSKSNNRSFRRTRTARKKR